MNPSLRTIVACGLAVMALGLGACASQGGANGGEQRSSAGQFIDDATLTTKVKAAIATDVGTKAAMDVKVTTEGGVVQLSGFATQDEATRAAAAAQKVSGVKSVKNDIRVK